MVAPILPGFTTGAVAPGGTVVVTATVTSATATTVLVLVDVVDPAGGKVLQRSFGEQAFAAGERKAYTLPWPAPAGAPHGTYTVRLGVFSAQSASCPVGGEIIGIPLVRIHHGQGDRTDQTD